MYTYWWGTFSKRPSASRPHLPSSSPLPSIVYTLLAPMHCSSCFLVLLWRFLASVYNQWKPTAKNFMRCVVLNLCFFFFQKLMHHSHEGYAMHMPLRKFALRWEFKEMSEYYFFQLYSKLSFWGFYFLSCSSWSSASTPPLKWAVHPMWTLSWWVFGNRHILCLYSSLRYLLLSLSLYLSLFHRYLFLCLLRLPGQFQTFWTYRTHVALYCCWPLQ